MAPMGYSRKKIKQGGWRLFWKLPGIFHFFTLPLEIPDKIKLYPRKFHKIALDPLEISKKSRPLEIPLYFYLVTVENSTSFLINPWKFHMLSVIPLEIPISSTPPHPCLFFFWNSPISCRNNNCNATFSTTSNHNKHEKKKNRYHSSTKAREHSIPYDETGKVCKYKNQSCKAVSKKKSNMKHHIKIIRSSNLAKIKETK